MLPQLLAAREWVMTPLLLRTLFPTGMAPTRGMDAAGHMSTTDYDATSLPLYQTDKVPPQPWVCHGPAGGDTARGEPAGCAPVRPDTLGESSSTASTISRFPAGQ